MPTRLIADIGGTNVRLALSEQGRPLDGTRVDFAVAEQKGLESCLSLYPFKDFSEAVIAVAGPPINNTIDFTNSRWFIDANRLSEETGKPFRLINDFTAQALGANQLTPDDLFAIGPDCTPEDGATSLVVLGTGTGLGVAGGMTTPCGFFPLAGEGGHVGISPRSALQSQVCDRLLAFLKTTRPTEEKVERLSAERILCGQGLVDLYGTLSEIETGKRKVINGKNLTAKALSDQKDGTESLERRTLNLFLDFLGNAAGDLALSFGAKKGIFVSGFLSGKAANDFLPFLNASPFRDAFEAKGRLGHFTAAIPTFLIGVDDTGLRGAAVFDTSPPIAS